MKKMFKSLLLVSIPFVVCLVTYLTVCAYTSTVESASYTHGGGTGNYCSMVTTAEISNSGTSLQSFYYKKGTSLGYSFSLQSSPTRYHYNNYDIYKTNNKLLWMNGSTTWNFTLTTTHAYP